MKCFIKRDISGFFNKLFPIYTLINKDKDINVLWAKQESIITKDYVICHN